MKVNAIPSLFFNLYYGDWILKLVCPQCFCTLMYHKWLIRCLEVSHKTRLYTLERAQHPMCAITVTITVLMSHGADSGNIIPVVMVIGLEQTRTGGLTPTLPKGFRDSQR